MDVTAMGTPGGLQRNPTLNRESAVALGAFGAVTAGAVALGSWATSREPSRRWFKRLRKPSFQPPDAVFGPVWTALYTLIAVSGWRVWGSAGGPSRSRALGLWAIQLGLNSAWSWLFFRKHQLRAAAVDNLFLLASIAAYTATARRVDRKAPLFMAPYLGWVGFANLLSADLARRNT